MSTPLVTAPGPGAAILDVPYRSLGLLIGLGPADVDQDGQETSQLGCVRDIGPQVAR